jgi:general stress protein 26
MADDRGYAALLAEFKTALLVTRGADGHLHGRPMAMRQQVRGEEIWFATSVRSKKCDDLAADAQCALTFTAADGTTVSVSGRGEIIRDKKLATSLWDRSWSRWFPEGPAHRDLALLRVIPEHVERHDGETGRCEVLFDRAPRAPTSRTSGGAGPAGAPRRRARAGRGAGSVATSRSRAARRRR